MADEQQDLNRANEPISGAVRTVIADGQPWEVREVPAPQFDRRGGTHLVFWGDSTMRRLRAFPPNWYELSDEDLYALTDRIERKA